jgi:hypothetical protein
MSLIQHDYHCKRKRGRSDHHCFLRLLWRIRTSVPLQLNFDFKAKLKDYADMLEDMGKVLSFQVPMDPSLKSR